MSDRPGGGSREGGAAASKAGEAPRDPRLGTWLNNKYHLDSVLGEGGMATVYAATHRNRKRFAIKILAPSLRTKAQIRRFLREGYVANTVDHPAALAVLDDAIAEDGAPFLVLELLDGLSLDQIVESLGPLDAQTVLSIGWAVADVLAKAHAKEVIHRDLKPGNIFLTRDGSVRVLDFGLARLREQDPTRFATGAGSALGTPEFMPPEQALGNLEEIDGRSDIWALGATLFYLLTGESVHQGRTPQELIIRAATSSPRRLSEVVPDAPEALVDLLARALPADRSRRFATAADFREAIERAHGELLGGAVDVRVLSSLIAEVETARGRPVGIPRLSARPPADTGMDPYLDEQVEQSRSARGLSVDAVSVQIEPAPPLTPSRRPLVLAGLAALLIVGGVAVVARLSPREGGVAGPDVSGGSADRSGLRTSLPTASVASSGAPHGPSAAAASPAKAPSAGAESAPGPRPGATTEPRATAKPAVSAVASAPVVKPRPSSAANPVVRDNATIRLQCIQKCMASGKSESVCADTQC